MYGRRTTETATQTNPARATTMPCGTSRAANRNTGRMMCDAVLAASVFVFAVLACLLLCGFRLPILFPILFAVLAAVPLLPVRRVDDSVAPMSRDWSE